MKINELNIGRIYDREDLRSAFGGSFYRGMNVCNKTGTLVLISKHTSNRIYGDLFDGDTLVYTGEGQVGDQELTGGNRKLYFSNRDHTPVHLFVVFKQKEYTYYGTCMLSGDPYMELENDTNGNPRKVFRFPLSLNKNNGALLNDDALKNTIVSGIKNDTKKHYRVVGAAIVNKDGEILCAQRGYGSLKGKWEFPGGKIEAGESRQEALKREIKEEMNLDIEILDEIDETYYEYDDFNINLSVFKCRYVSGTLKDVEHQSLKWIKKNDLDCLDWAPADESAVERLMQELPREIEGEPVKFDYFESKPVEHSEKETKRAVQDYVKSQKAKQDAGDAAEEAVVRYEKGRLNNEGHPELANLVKRVSSESSDYGYDVLSYEKEGSFMRELHIEVKSAKKTSGYLEFFISENELQKFKDDDCHKIYCLYKHGKSYKLHVVNKTDFFANQYLMPLSYRVRIRIVE